jgi:tetratricopeptide (TPR) repeat protein
MCDTMMLAFWVWAILLWIRGTERNEHLAFGLSAFLIGVCALTKYYGMSLIILLPIYSFVKNRRIGLWLIYLIIPILILILYQWKTDTLYGRGLLLDAGAYASEFRARLNFGLTTKGLIGLAFAGGCLATILFYVPVLWSKRVLLLQMAVLVVVIFAISSAETIGIFPLHDAYGVKWSQVIQLAILVIIGMNLLALAVADLWNHKGDPASLLLFCWVMGTFTFASFINWSVNGRSMLPMAPVLGILLVRRIEQGALSFKRYSILFGLLVPAIFVALLVTWADYGLANSARSAVEKIYASYQKGPGTLWFQGHWGFQYYMELRGAKIAGSRKFRPATDDILIVPENNYGTFPVPPDKIVSLREAIELPSVCRWLTTMNRFGGAGFYGDVWGILPFVIGATLPERYNILQIEPIRHINHTPSVIDKNKEEYDKAISDYTQVLTIYPYYAEIYNNRGNAYFLKGEYDKAISDYTQALRIDSKDIKTYQKRGTVYIKNREYDKAIFDFDQAIRINPNDVKAYHNRAVAYSGKGEYDKAWEDVKKLRSLGFDINPAFLEQLRRSSGRQQ